MFKFFEKLKSAVCSLCRQQYLMMDYMSQENKVGRSLTCATYGNFHSLKGNCDTEMT